MKKIFAAVTATCLVATTAFAASNTTTISGMSAKESKPGVIHLLDLEPEDQTYTVKQDATYRIGPNTRFHAKGTLKKGDIIESVGKARSWVAFEKDGQVVFVWDGLVNPWKAWPSTTTQISE